MIFKTLTLFLITPDEAYYRCLKQNKRIPEFEPIIATNTYYSYLYARDVLKGRFELGEPIITTDVYYSYHYARDVIKGKFELEEI